MKNHDEGIEGLNSGPFQMKPFNMEREEDSFNVHGKILMLNPCSGRVTEWRNSGLLAGFL